MAAPTYDLSVLFLLTHFSPDTPEGAPPVKVLAPLRQALAGGVSVGDRVSTGPPALWGGVSNVEARTAQNGQK